MDRGPERIGSGSCSRRHPALSRRSELKRDILRFIDQGQPDEFDTLALRVAQYQSDTLTPYGALVEATHGALTHWRAAPLVPTEVFRDVDLSPEHSKAEAVFLTSGTTGIGRQGMRRVPDLELYHAGCRTPFIESVLGEHTKPIAWLSLIPSASELPDSSLSHMVSILGEELASTLVFGANRQGLLLAEIQRTLEEWNQSSTPYLLLTTSFALVQLLDTTLEIPKAPAGSRMMLTGGFKGRAREVSEEELVADIDRRLGISKSDIVSEYGMTELSSQAYGTPFKSPNWLKIRVLDPVTLQDVSPGQQGLVGFFDLLNLDNVSAIVTSDLGVIDDHGGLTLQGRAPGSRTRGCSLRAEEWGTP